MGRNHSNLTDSNFFFRYSRVGWKLVPTQPKTSIEQLRSHCMESFHWKLFVFTERAHLNMKSVAGCVCPRACDNTKFPITIGNNGAIYEKVTFINLDLRARNSDERRVLNQFRDASRGRQPKLVLNAAKANSSSKTNTRLLIAPQQALHPANISGQ